MIVHTGHPLAELTTFGLPAEAERFVACRSENEVRAALLEARSKGWPLTVLGGGSNVLLIADLPGLVLQNDIRGLEVVKAEGDDVWVRAGAGEPWHAFVMACLDQGWFGLENLSLIPGSVGASPMQNIGAYGVEVESRFHALEAVAVSDGRLHTFDHAQCGFGYRESVFKRELKGQFVITAVTFKLSRKAELHLDYGAIREELASAGVDNPTPRDVSDAVIRIRQSKLPDPRELGNAGSFFKNPVLPQAAFERLKSQHPNVPHYPAPDGVKVAAGWLIDQAGWKGHDRGTHGVHHRQALVLVHRGGGTGAELDRLARDIQGDVLDKFGVALEREVNVLPVAAAGS